MRMPSRRFRVVLSRLLIVYFLGEHSAAWAAEPTPESVRVFLKAHCVRCHGEKKCRGDVNFEALMADGTDALQRLKTWKQSPDPAFEAKKRASSASTSGGREAER